jgi:chitin disaccharide deacetylase
VNSRRIILNADDLGYEPNVTRGLLKSMKEGIVSSATMIVNGPWSHEAVLRAHGLPVGLHLNLARWKPLSEVPKEFLSPSGELVELRAVGLPAEVVQGEVHAQLDALFALLGTPATHIDVHKHLHRFPNVLDGLLAAAKVHALPVRSIDDLMRSKARAVKVATNHHFFGDAGATGYWTLEQLESTLKALPAEGIVELMCHPGYAPKELTSGYAAQREVELETFTSPKAKALLADLGVTLSSWSGVRYT